MKIKVKDEYMQSYEAEIVEFEALQDFMFKVSYYDDIGVLNTEVVDHHRLVLNSEIEKRKSL
jgi:hypothetical protein